MSSRPKNPFEFRLGTCERGAELERFVNKIGYRYASATLGNFEIYEPKTQQPVLDMCRSFSERMPAHLAKGGGVVFFGPPGTGKDHLLSALLKLAVALHGFTVDWWDGVTLFAASRNSIDEHGERALMKSLIAPQILAISDPQPPKGQLSQFQTTLLREAIDARYRAGKSTWLTTNLDSRVDSEALLTAPLLQRLREGSMRICCEWESWRDRQKPML